MKITTLHMDNYYDGWTTPFSNSWESIISEAIDCHKKRAPLSLKRYDWAAMRYQSAVQEKSAELLILEGVGSGSAFIRENLSALIWMEIDPEIGFKRVMERDGDEINSQMRHWLELQSQHFSHNEVEIQADFILST